MRLESSPTLSLYTRDGCRKYVTPAERERFMIAARSCPRAELGTLCLMLAYSGCRISEAMALTAGSLDRDEAFVAIPSLKKRGAIVVREIPLPTGLLDRLGVVHDLAGAAPATRLWPLSRGRAWQLVKIVMADAGIAGGPHMTPKGLRHGFAVHAIKSGVPLHLVQRWLGHASIATTAIYTQVIGQDERDIAARMWTVPPA